MNSEREFTGRRAQPEAARFVFHSPVTADLVARREKIAPFATIRTKLTTRDVECFRAGRRRQRGSARPSHEAYGANRATPQRVEAVLATST